MSKNKELQQHIRALGNDETEKAIIQLEDNYHQASGKNLPQVQASNFRSIDMQGGYSKLNENSMYGGPDTDGINQTSEKKQHSPDKVVLP